jgi:hypothetical protein
MAEAAEDAQETANVPVPKRRLRRYFQSGKYKIGKNGGVCSGKKTMAKAPKSAI